jgi:hypothetical protein
MLATLASYQKQLKACTSDALKLGFRIATCITLESNSSRISVTKKSEWITHNAIGKNRESLWGILLHARLLHADIKYAPAQ